MKDSATHTTHWRIEKYLDKTRYVESRPYAVSHIDGNLLLNEGINNLWDLATGSGTSWATPYLGVGDSLTAVSASQTGLQAATNKVYVAADAGYPTTDSQQIVVQATFDGDTANFDWNEFTICTGDSDAGVNLNRAVSAQGTKTSGQIWVLTVDVTLS